MFVAMLRGAGVHVPRFVGLERINQPARLPRVRLAGDDIMTHVVVKVGDKLVKSIITRTSAEGLGLQKGDAVAVVVKSE